jgi:hypothetical protein
MVRKGRGTARQPATKFAQLRKKMDKNRAALEAKLLEGLASGPPVEMTNRDWAEIRKRALKRAEARKKR